MSKKFPIRVWRQNKQGVFFQEKIDIFYACSSPQSTLKKSYCVDLDRIL